MAGGDRVSASPSPAGFAYVWEFHVAPEHVGNFERVYGPDGDWAQLFRRHVGYVRTDLLRDTARTGRYLTIDYWNSQAARDDFRRRFNREFEALDARCGQWTLSEAHLGDFTLP